MTTIVLSVLIPVSSIAGITLIAIACIRKKQENIAKEIDRLRFEENDDFNHKKKKSASASKYKKDDDDSSEDDIKKIKMTNIVYPGV